jgi:hypothetical protein
MRAKIKKKTPYGKSLRHIPPKIPEFRTANRLLQSAGKILAICCQNDYYTANSGKNVQLAPIKDL